MVRWWSTITPEEGLAKHHAEAVASGKTPHIGEPPCFDRAPIVAGRRYLAPLGGKHLPQGLRESRLLRLCPLCFGRGELFSNPDGGRARVARAGAYWRVTAHSVAPGRRS